MRKLYNPPGYLELSPDEKAKICNGCGASGAKFDFVPDTVWWLSITEACDRHDYMYFVAKPKLEEKAKADQAFRYNMLVIVENQSGNFFTRWLRRIGIQKYYLAVKHFGGPAFWEGKEKC